MKTAESDAIYRYYESAGYAQVELDNGVVFWYKIEKENENGNDNV